MTTESHPLSGYALTYASLCTNDVSDDDVSLPTVSPALQQDLDNEHIDSQPSSLVINSFDFNLEFQKLLDRMPSVTTATTTTLSSDDTTTTFGLVGDEEKGGSFNINTHSRVVGHNLWASSSISDKEEEKDNSAFISVAPAPPSPVPVPKKDGVSSIIEDDPILFYESLVQLVQDFRTISITYSKIIICEQFLSPELRSLQPLDANTAGGIAGGSKYVKHGILFKFADNSHGLYRNLDDAGKTSKHDLIGCAAIFHALGRLNYDHKKENEVGEQSTNQHWIRLPLMAVVDYRGYRLTCMSVLPISKATIVYGSHDIGKTIHATEPRLNEAMAEVGKLLNLSSYQANDGRATVHIAFDLEGHKGNDQRSYLCDFGRVLPPEYPSLLAPKGSHLFRLFRPEFVASNPVPLCPDSFSQICNEKKRQEFATNIIEATHRLKARVIPQFAHWLLRESQHDVDMFPDRSSISQLLHVRGINVRYLHRVLFEIIQTIDIHDEYSETNSLEPARKWATIIIMEMCCRTIKQQIRAYLRAEMSEHGRGLTGAADERYNRVVLKQLNKYLLISPREVDYFKNSWKQRNYCKKINKEAIKNWTSLLHETALKFVGDVDTLPTTSLSQQEKEISQSESVVNSDSKSTDNATSESKYRRYVKFFKPYEWKSTRGANQLSREEGERISSDDEIEIEQAVAFLRTLKMNQNQNFDDKEKVDESRTTTVKEVHDKIVAQVIWNLFHSKDFAIQLSRNINRAKILSRLCDMLGIVLTSATTKARSTQTQRNFSYPLSEMDISHMQLVMHDLNLISFARARLYHLRGLQEVQPVQQKLFFRFASFNYRQAIGSCSYPNYEYLSGYHEFCCQNALSIENPRLSQAMLNTAQSCFNAARLLPTLDSKLSYKIVNDEKKEEEGIEICSSRWVQGVKHWLNYTCELVHDAEMRVYGLGLFVGSKIHSSLLRKDKTKETRFLMIGDKSGLLTCISLKPYSNYSGYQDQSKTLHTHEGWIRDICISPCGQFCLTCGDYGDSRVALSRIHNKIPHFEICQRFILSEKRNVKITSLAILTNPLLSKTKNETKFFLVAAVGLYDGVQKIQIFLFDKTDLSNTLPATTGKNIIHAFQHNSPVANFLCTLSHENAVRINNRNVFSSLKAFNAVSISDSEYSILLACGSPNHTISIWRITVIENETTHIPIEVRGSFQEFLGEPDNTESAKGHTKAISALESTDSYFISSSFDGTIRLYEIDTLKCIQVLRGHTHGIWSLACLNRASSGTILVSGASDGTVRIWNLDSSLMRCVRVLTCDETAGDIYSVDIAEAGNKVLVCCSTSSGKVFLWTF